MSLLLVGLHEHTQSLLRLKFYLRIFGLGVDDDVLLEALELF